MYFVVCSFLSLLHFRPPNVSNVHTLRIMWDTTVFYLNVEEIYYYCQSMKFQNFSLLQHLLVMLLSLK